MISVQIKQRIGKNMNSVQEQRPQHYRKYSESVVEFVDFVFAFGSERMKSKRTWQFVGIEAIFFW